jgi:hypothetical protein
MAWRDGRLNTVDSFGLVEGDAEAEQRQAHFDRFLVGVLHVHVGRKRFGMPRPRKDQRTVLAPMAWNATGHDPGENVGVDVRRTRPLPGNGFAR